MSNQVDPKHDNPFQNGKYLGNIFGWKFSFGALAFLLLFMGFMAFRFWSLDVPVSGVFDGLEEELNEPVESDTLKDTTF